MSFPATDDDQTAEVLLKQLTSLLEIHGGLMNLRAQNGTFQTQVTLQNPRVQVLTGLGNTFAVCLAEALSQYREKY